MRYTIAHTILRLSLGLVYLWSGIDMIRHPLLWTGWFPAWFVEASPLKDAPLLFILAAAQFILAAMLLVGIRVRWAAALSTLFFAAILLSVGQYVITFRDIGLLGASIFFVLEPTAGQHVQQE